jgi:hypothetical protein
MKNRQSRKVMFTIYLNPVHYLREIVIIFMKVVTFFRDVYLGIKWWVNKRLFHGQYNHYMVFLFAMPFVLDFMGNIYYYYNFCFGPRTHFTMDVQGGGFRPHVQGWYYEEGYYWVGGEMKRIRKNIVDHLDQLAKISHLRPERDMPTFYFDVKTKRPNVLSDPFYWTEHNGYERLGWVGSEYWQGEYKAEDVAKYLEKVGIKLNQEKFLFETKLVSVQEHPHYDHRYSLFEEDVYLVRDPRYFSCRLEHPEQRQLGQDGGAEHDMVRNIYLEDLDVDFLFDWGVYLAAFALFTYEVVFWLLASGSFFKDRNLQIVVHDEVNIE